MYSQGVVVVVGFVLFPNNIFKSIQEMKCNMEKEGEESGSQCFLLPNTRCAASAILSRLRDQMCRVWAFFTPWTFSSSSFTSS